jgi:uncharacterized protein (DUF1499 family)
MAKNKQKHPLPPCPATPNCMRSYQNFNSGIEQVFEALTDIFEDEAHSFKIIDPKRIEIHAVYKIPIFGFKDDVDVIMEESESKTTAYIRSASRLGAYDLGVNKRRVNRIFRKLNSKISD